MSLQSVWSERLEFHPQKRLDVENSAGRLSSDAGRLAVREFDERLGLTEQFAGALHDTRLDPDHSLLSMVLVSGQRLEPRAGGGHQGRMPCGGNEPAGRGHQPGRRDDRSARRLRPAR